MVKKEVHESELLFLAQRTKRDSGAEAGGEDENTELAYVGPVFCDDQSFILSGSIFAGFSVFMRSGARFLLPFSSSEDNI